MTLHKKFHKPVYKTQNSCWTASRILNTKYQSGFSLFEMVVTIGILSVLSLMVGVGFPAARDHQRIVSTEEQLQELLRLSLQRATHEVRPAECLDDPRVGDDPAIIRRCSNVGVAVGGTQVTTFADLDGDRLHSPADVVFEERTLAAPVTGTRSFVFEATPPTVELYENGQPVTTNRTGQIIVSSGRERRVLQVLPFGQLELVTGNR